MKFLCRFFVVRARLVKVTLFECSRAFFFLLVRFNRFSLVFMSTPMCWCVFITSYYRARQFPRHLPRTTICVFVSSCLCCSSWMRSMTFVVADFMTFDKELQAKLCNENRQFHELHNQNKCFFVSRNNLVFVYSESTLISTKSMSNDGLLSRCISVHSSHKCVLQAYPENSHWIIHFLNLERSNSLRNNYQIDVNFWMSKVFVSAITSNNIIFDFYRGNFID